MVLNAEHLRRILAKYATYYNEVQTHVAWEGRALVLAQNLKINVTAVGRGCERENAA